MLRDRAKIQSEAGETLSKVEEREAMPEIHGNITRELRQRRCAAFHVFDEVRTDSAAWTVKVDEIVDEICCGMNETPFAAPE